MAQSRKTVPRKTANVVNDSKSSKKNFYTILGIAGFLGIAVLAFLSQQAGKNRVIALDPNLPAVTSQGYVAGSPDAPVEITEFGDFECPACADFAQLQEPELREKYINTGKLRLRFIDYPLNIHPNSLNASNAAACADEQGKFWEMHDLIYATQYQWNATVNRNPDKHFKEIAKQIQGLDQAKLGECIDSRRNMAKVQSHLKLATDRGISGTPSFIYQNLQLNFPPGMAGSLIAKFVDSVLTARATPGTTKKP